MEEYLTMRIDQWAGLASAMAIQACGGLTYTYAVYSEHLKEVLQFTQVQVDEIGAAKDFGQSLGILGGLLFNLYPPFVTVSIGAVLHFFGYMIVLMTLSRKMSPPFWLLTELSRASRNCFGHFESRGGTEWGHFCNDLQGIF